LTDAKRCLKDIAFLRITLLIDWFDLILGNKSPRRKQRDILEEPQLPIIM
jgi:hypothetical protein